MTHEITPAPTALLGELRQLIEQSRTRAAQAVNSELVWLYWQVGRRLRQDVVGEGRGAYGEQVVALVAEALSAEHGRGFTKRNLHYMMKFAEVFPDSEIVHALRAQLTWTHLREIIAFDDPLKRQFYAEMCRVERWSTRTLQQKVAGTLSRPVDIDVRAWAVRRGGRLQTREGPSWGVGDVFVCRLAFGGLLR